MNSGITWYEFVKRLFPDANTKGICPKKYLFGGYCDHMTDVDITCDKCIKTDTIPISIAVKYGMLTKDE